MKYIADTALGYLRIRWSPSEGVKLELDTNYRTAHLPLLYPDHPDVVVDSADGIYRSGRYVQTRFSLVLPVSVADLEANPAFRKVDEAMRSSGFADKIAWDVMEQRRSLMHATISGGLFEADLPDIAASLEEYIAKHGSPAYRVGGPIIGQKNTGRIYFPVFPEDRNGENSFHALQGAIGKPRTDIFLVGYYSLFDHLNVQQTAELAKLLEQFAASTLLESIGREVWLLATNDDLVLSGTVRSRVGSPLHTVS